MKCDRDVRRPDVPREGAPHVTTAARDATYEPPFDGATGVCVTAGDPLGIASLLGDARLHVTSDGAAADTVARRRMQLDGSDAPASDVTRT
jgi:hypothetical protein